MKIKADWEFYLHKIRERELNLVFQKFPQKKIFESALEIGAGDGFQSGILSKYSMHLISTDYNAKRLKNVSIRDIEYRICDAEVINAYFKDKQFDFVFSSNLLEHLPRPDSALKAIHGILKDNGITVHVVPNQFWKFLHIFLFYPNLLFTKVKELSKAGSLGEFLSRKLIHAKKETQNRELFKRGIGSNLKMKTQKSYSIFRRLLWPVPHGAYENNIVEFFAWQRKRWLREFDKAGFNIIKIIKGPACSGYGFNLDRIRAFLEKITLSSEYIYVAEKKDKVSKYRKYV
jgi:2-polyprenyl-3-methyl-5-hydroxy-6-metoxy-1,4-benzoquinol methylase